MDEYAFWMDGSKRLKSAGDMLKRVVKMPDNSVLNRYWDDFDDPRPESFKEDIHVADESVRNRQQVFRDLRAGAESGWDYSSRWLADQNTLPSIETTHIVPVDLNSLLYHLEILLAEIHTLEGDTVSAANYYSLAEKRKKALIKYCWNDSEKYFADHHLDNQKVQSQLTMATAYPLFFRIADREKANGTMNAMTEHLEKPGGYVTTLINSGEQWDAPNGWPPLQYIGVVALMNYGRQKDARRIMQKWTTLNQKIYQNTGKMMEKYNVIDLSLTAGGGEYPLQDGFGWSNGVYLKFMQMLKDW